MTLRESNHFLTNLIKEDKPFTVLRLGGIEAFIALNVMFKNKIEMKYIFILGRNAGIYCRGPQDIIKYGNLYNLAIKIGFFLPSIISPTAYVSKHSKIGDGSVIMHNAIVNANTSIGVNSIINSQALIEHDCIIAEHCHISTNATINGGVQIGSKCFVGSNVITKENIKIMDNTFIKAGSLVKWVYL